MVHRAGEEIYGMIRCCIAEPYLKHPKVPTTTVSPQSSSLLRATWHSAVCPLASLLSAKHPLETKSFPFSLRVSSSFYSLLSMRVALLACCRLSLCVLPSQPLLRRRKNWVVGLEQGHERSLPDSRIPLKIMHQHSPPLKCWLYSTHETTLTTHRILDLVVAMLQKYKSETKQNKNTC